LMIPPLAKELATNGAANRRLRRGVWMEMHRPAPGPFALKGTLTFGHGMRVPAMRESTQEGEAAN
jgi:hypothetical protein